MTATVDPPVVLYGHWICPFVTRVAFALAQRGIEHGDVVVPPSAIRPDGFVMPPEFVEHSPRREIPMLRIGDDYLADSIPILEWMEERLTGDSSLLPTDEADRSLVRERMRWIDEHLFRAMIGVYYGTDADRIARSADRLDAAFRQVAIWLDESDWLAGDEPTLAEAVAIPVYVRLDSLRRLGFHHPIPDAVESHLARCRSLPGWPAVAWTPAQVDEFEGRFEAHRRKA